MTLQSLYNLCDLFIKWAQEAPKNAPFGEYLFPQDREGVDSKEPPTKLEKYIREKLKKHFASSHEGLDKKSVKLLMKCLENGWYKKILHPPPQKTLYRGLRFNDKTELAKFLKIKESNLQNDEGSLDFNDSVKISPEEGYSTSWTYKKKISEDFSKPETHKKGIAVTLIANLKDNHNRFLAGPNGLYDIWGLSRWHLEKETVGLEPIIVRRIEWEEYSKK